MSRRKVMLIRCSLFTLNILSPSSFISDHSFGFGGKFGVQKDRLDKSAVGWEHHEKVDKHESQKGKLIICLKNLMFL